MKLLLQVNSVSEYEENDVNYAIVNLSEEARLYLETRKASFLAMNNIIDDLVNMRFCGFCFITYYTSLNVMGEISEDEERIFDEQGYLELPDGFVPTAVASNVERELLTLDDEGWFVSAHEKCGTELVTRTVPFQAPTPETQDEIIERSR